MLKKSRKTNPTFTCLCTEIREKRFTLNFSKASPTQTDKGQARPSYFKQTLRILTQYNQNVEKCKNARSKIGLKAQKKNYAHLNQCCKSRVSSKNSKKLKCTNKLDFVICLASRILTAFI